jgi:hypothetical protein
MPDAKHTPGPWRNNCFQVYAGQDRIAHTGMGQLGAARSAEAEANARLIAAAPELDAAAGLAITALSFEQEKAQREGDTFALAQITHAKNALIAAQDKARGRDRPMLDITPDRAAIDKATGAA